MIEIDDNIHERRAVAGYAAVVMFQAFRADPLAVLLYLSAPPVVRRSIAVRFIAHERHRPPELFAEKILKETRQRRDKRRRARSS